MRYHSYDMVLLLKQIVGWLVVIVCLLVSFYYFLYFINFASMELFGTFIFNMISAIMDGINTLCQKNNLNFCH